MDILAEVKKVQGQEKSPIGNLVDFIVSMRKTKNNNKRYERNLFLLYFRINSDKKNSKR